jgi:hypothetical protein
VVASLVIINFHIKIPDLIKEHARFTFPSHIDEGAPTIEGIRLLIVGQYFKLGAGHARGLKNENRKPVAKMQTSNLNTLCKTVGNR